MPLTPSSTPPASPGPAPGAQADPPAPDDASGRADSSGKGYPAGQRGAARAAKPWLPMPRVTPFTLLADRVSVGRRGLYWATTAALLMSVVLMVTGGIVRVTGSGLGCPDWPACTDDSITTTAAMGIHGAIEFTNRMLTWVLCAAVGWSIIASRLHRPHDLITTRLAWSQFWMVMLNAVIGGITVITGLNPYTVALHFVAATALLTATTVTWHRVRAADLPRAEPVGERSHRWGRALLASSAVVVVAGTIVTGTGPHAGDSSEVHRIPLNWTAVTWVHGLAAAAVLLIAVGLYRSLPAGADTARFRVRVFFAVLGVQAAIGLFQSLTSLPEIAVVLHLFGAALVWIGAVRVALDTPRSESSPTVAYTERAAVS